MQSDLLALAAIALWSTLATLGVKLGHVPPFLLTGIALLTGSLISLPLARWKVAQWKVPLPTFCIGVAGLFGYHFLLFMALRSAPAVEANLVNYLWPLGIVVLGPVFFPGNRLRWHHILAALAGFTGAAIAIVGRGDTGLAWSGAGSGAGFHSGYLLAAAGALVWSCYSLMTRRLPRFPTAAVGGFAAASGLLALLCHVLLEPAVTLSVRDSVLLAVLGLGPLGGAFYLWDAALKRGEPRRIGLLAFATPILSTVLLLLSTGQGLHWNVGLAALLVVGGALWGSRD